jgi:nicotinate-nucleotide pyrophosphorylase (carboxylating)
MSFSHLLPPHYRETLREYLASDAPSFDIGGFVVGDAPGEAVLLFKAVPGAAGAAVGGAVLAGVPFFDAVFAELGCTVEWLAREGDVLVPPARAAVVRGPTRALLLGERTALNILARASGIATAARQLVNIALAAGWKGEVAGTRKTTPGFRLVEKYALIVGGASTHRHDLSQMVMLKGAFSSRAIHGPQYLTLPNLPTPRQSRVGGGEHRIGSRAREARGRLFDKN